jgi:peptidoglycan-associated lipoprotein
MRRKMVVLFPVFLVFMLTFFTASCAKKQIQKADEGVRPVTSEPKQAEVAKPDGDYESRKRAEEEHLAKLREQEERLQKEIRAFESENIYFDFDKADLKPEAKAVLKKKAQWLLDNAQFSVRIEGHCDERGTNEYNLALGERRANTAKAYMIALGVSEKRLSSVTYGEERPADQGHNEKAWAKNRRDEFSLMK